MAKKAITKNRFKQTPQIKRLPATKTKSHRRKGISIDVKPERNNIASTIEFIKRDFNKTQRSEMPSKLLPMLAVKSKTPFNHRDWLFEIKWDGYRSLAYIANGNVELRSRKNLLFNSDYPEITEALASWKINAIVDGEITVLNEEGKADFEALQRWRRIKTGSIAYYVFDILWLEGYNLMELPLYKRKEILRKLVPDKGPIKYSDNIEEIGKEFFEAAKQNEIEGIIGKHKDSLYHPDKKTKMWLKMPVENRREFVIGGWTESDSGRPFKSLIFGYYKGNDFIYVGHAGGGYKDDDMPRILSQVKKLEAKNKPFVNSVKTDSKAHWTKPVLVAEIKFSSFTSSRQIRKPAIFLGFRNDKNAKDVVAEEQTVPAPKETPTKAATRSKSKATTALDSNWRILAREKIKHTEDRVINDRTVTITDPDKQIWAGVTKNDLLLYYQAVSPYLLPHLMDRPLSLHIKHKGPFVKGLYIKDMESHEPEWAETIRTKREHPKPGKRNIIDYLVCNDEATLQFVINLGCIDINPWTSRAQTPKSPDYIIIDLDPSDEDFLKVIETARVARQFFDKRKLIAFPKTSGKTGMHIYLPCQGFDFKQARRIAENICNEIHYSLPTITTRQLSTDMRGDKLYIDHNQNDYADTVAAPYSVRPYKLPLVSTPVEWKEVTRKLKPENFKMQTVSARLKMKGDLFKNVLLQSNRQRNQKSLMHFL
jgi:bifunctional non-homologous end joining protein LigD